MILIQYVKHMQPGILARYGNKGYYAFTKTDVVILELLTTDF